MGNVEQTSCEMELNEPSVCLSLAHLIVVKCCFLTMMIDDSPSVC